MANGATSRRFVPYYRVSTGGQGRSGLGLEAQRVTAHGYMGDVEPIAEFVEVESGKRTDRPELAKALAACRLHNATLVIAKLDRLARNAQFLMGLVDSGVDVVFCDLPQIPPGAVGRFLLQQMANVAELERGLISERTKAALAAAKARGQRLGNDGSNLRNPAMQDRIAAGRARGTAARKANADKRAADVLPVIRTIQAEGAASLRELAAALNARQISAARGGEWSAVQVRRVLQTAAA